MDRDLQRHAATVLERDVTPTDQLVSTIRNLVKEGEDTAIRLERDAYEGFFREADANGVTFDPDELANFIQLSYAKNKVRPGENPVIERTIKELRNRKGNTEKLNMLRAQRQQVTDSAQAAAMAADIAVLERQSGPLDSRQFRQLFKTVRDEVPAGQMVAPTDSVLQGRVVSDDMNQLFHGKLPANLRTQWDDATARLNHRMTYEGGVLNDILQEAHGATTKLTDTQVLASILSDPSYVRNVIGVAESVDPAAGAQLRLQMQRSYLEQIKVGRNVGTGISNFDFNPDMVRELWGVNKQGVSNQNYGERMIEKLKILNEHIKKNNILADKITEG